MREYGQYCPVAKSAELLGDRWTLLIVREMMFGPLRFTEIERGLPGISRSVLSTRLRRLESNRIIEPLEDGTGYQFTPAGESLRSVIRAMGEWVATWIMEDPRPAELDPELLMLFISRHVDREKLDDGKTILSFEFNDDPRRFWLTLERHDVSVCLEDPCLPVAVTVQTSVRELFRVYMGRTTLNDAIASDTLALHGMPSDRRHFVELMQWSKFAPFVKASINS